MEEVAWQPHARGQVNERNRAIVRGMPSILSDKHGCDPHHWPVKRSHLSTDGLLEMVPLTREEHDLAEKNDQWTLCFLETNAPSYFCRIYRAYGKGDCYMGPPERVAEIRRQVEKEDKTRGLLGTTVNGIAV